MSGTRIRDRLFGPRATVALPDPSVPLQRGRLTYTLDRVLERASAVPAAPAIRDAESREITYGALGTAAQVLGHRLLDAGVGPGDIVAIWASRSMSLPWAMLGVWCAGAAFTILDADAPTSRSEAVIGVARPKALIDLDGARPMPESLITLLQDAGCTAMVKLPAAPTEEWLHLTGAYVRPAISEADPAYVVFTSGTTTTPKGIVSGHAPLAHFLDWHRYRFALGANDCVAMLDGLAHDPLLRSIFTPLVSGGILVVPNPAMMRDPVALRALMDSEGVSVVHLTPSMGRLLALGHDDDLRTPSLPILRRVFFAGEPLYRSAAQRMIALAPNALCVNYYGATETPQAMGHWVINPVELAAADASSVVPIGHGIADVQLLVVDADGRRVAIGEPGEICVRTPYLAFGYLHDRDETAERFVVNSVTRDSGDRMYRTGDRGRYAADGSVVTMGRSDRQVKMRGYRVELDEIEARIGEDPRVRHVAVDVERNASDPELRIVAHIAADAAMPARALRAALRHRLPEYMMPSRVTVISELPLTANGKVDRDALAELRIADDTDDSDVALRSDDTIQALTTLWRDALGLDHVATDDNFFDLGGHSLLALELLLRIERRFHRRLPAHLFMQAPTIAQMAAALRDAGGSERSALAIPMRGGSSGSPVFLVPGSGGLSVIAMRELAARIAEGHAVFGLEAELDVAQSDTTVTALAREFRVAMRALQPRGPYHLVGYSGGAFMAWEIATQLRARGEEIGSLVLIDAPVPRHTSVMDSVRVMAHRAGRAVRSMVDSAVVPQRATLGLSERTPSNSVFDTIERRNAKAIERYARAPLPTFDGSVTVLLARDSALHGVDASIDPRLAWRHSAAAVSAQTIPGNHATLLQTPHVDMLAAVVSSCLTPITHEAALGAKPKRSRRGRNTRTPRQQSAVTT